MAEPQKDTWVGVFHVYYGGSYAGSLWAENVYDAYKRYNARDARPKDPVRALNPIGIIISDRLHNEKGFRWLDDPAREISIPPSHQNQGWLGT